MQGDYMALDFEVTRKISYDSKSGYVVVKVGSDRVAEFVRFQDGKDVNDGELIVRYSRHKGRLTIGADNYFFQEGSAKKFEKAKYGLLKVDSDGNSILIGLCNEDGQFIE